MSKKEIQPISIEELKDIASGKIIKIPSWEGVDRPYIPVRVKTIDFTKHLMELDQMPNKLMQAAQEVFEGKPEDKRTKEEKAMDFLQNNKEELERMKPVITAMAKEALVEPTFEDFEESGMPLNFAQKMAIFQHVVSGVKQVEPFRKKSGQNDTAGSNG